MSLGDPPPWPWNDAYGYLPCWTVRWPQEPLGQEFERAIFRDVWSLYIRDVGALWFWQDDVLGQTETE